MKKNKKAPASKKAEELYLLTTKLFCGKCGAVMVGESGVSRNQKIYRYYKCIRNKKGKQCNKQAIKKDWIENLVIEQTIKMIMDDNWLEQIVDKLFDLQNKENTSLTFLKKQLVETEKGIQHMLNAIQQGILTPSTKQRLEELEATKEDLEINIVKEKMQKPLLSKHQIKYWINGFRTIDLTDPKQRERLVDSFVNAVFVYDDKIILTFNYKDGQRAITLDEVKSSDLDRLPPPEKPC